MHRIGSASLRIVPSVLLAGSVLVQLVLPAAAEALGGGNRETEQLVGPYAAMGVLSVTCLQLAIGALWWLLHQTTRERALSRGVLGGLDVLTDGAIGATAIPALTMLHLLVVIGVGGPGVVLMVTVCLATAGAATLLLRSARRALRSAMALRPAPAAER